MGHLGQLATTARVGWETLAVLCAGFASGVLAAILGVGGAVVTTPFIRFLGATPIEAVGSTVPAILPGALSGTIRYVKEGLVEWRVATTCGLAGVAFAVAGALVAGRVNAGWLMIMTALLVLWSGLSILRSSGARAAPGEPPPEPAPVRDGTAPLVALGVIAGFLAGLLGIGGGLVLTPGLTVGVRLPVKRAIATSLVAVMFMSVTSLLTHWQQGHINWRYAGPLAIGIVPGARLGSRFTVSSSDRTVRLVCGGLLVVIAVIYLAREIALL